MHFRCIIVARVFLKNSDITYNEVSLYLHDAEDRTQALTLHSYLYCVVSGHICILPTCVQVHVNVNSETGVNCDMFQLRHLFSNNLQMFSGTCCMLNLDKKQIETKIWVAF